MKLFDTRDFYNEIHQPLDGCTYLVIVLTVAHLDQDEENWQVKDHRLKTLCQYCHLQYGTWFDAIGTWNFQKNGEMAVNTLCRGNYVCRAVNTVEDLQLLFFALTGNKLELKDECSTVVPSACPNCKEPMNECACFRNKCVRCLEPVGNITFTVCDDCWDKKTYPQN